MMNQKLRQTLAILFIVAIAGAVNAQDVSTLTDPLSPQEIDEFGIRVSDVRSAELPGYRKIERMLIAGSSPELEAMLRSVFPDIEFSFVAGDGSVSPGPYDAVAGGGRGVNVVAETGGAAWVHTYSAGVDWLASIDWVSERRPIVTNSSGASAPAIAEHVIAMTLSHARQLHGFRDAQLQATWDRSGGFYADPWQVNGKTMLVLGLGAIGTQIAQKANALGMRVLAVRNSRREGPDFVEYVGLSHEMVELAAQADVVANALPLTDDTRGVIDAEFFAAMKPTAIIVNIGRGATINTDDLVAAIRDGQIAGAGLDVTDPEPLPSDHPLWGMREVIITPHVAGSGMPQETRIRLLVDNIRRYQAGEPLLNPVNLEAGY